MIPVDQQFLHDPANGQEGDCFRACIASILELPIEDVPHFAQLTGGRSEDFWNMAYDWLEDRGYGYVHSTMLNGPIFSKGSYHLLSGPSPRGIGWHCVVALCGKIVHDPHPSRAGLAGTQKEWLSAYLVEGEKT